MGLVWMSAHCHVQLLPKSYPWLTTPMGCVNSNEADEGPNVAWAMRPAFSPLRISEKRQRECATLHNGCTGKGDVSLLDFLKKNHFWMETDENLYLHLYSIYILYFQSTLTFYVTISTSTSTNIFNYVFIYQQAFKISSIHQNYTRGFSP